MAITIYSDPKRAWLGRVHHRAFPSAKRAAAQLGHTPWTEYEHRRNGSPFMRSLLNAQPFVVEVFLVTVKAIHSLEDWTPVQLAEREKLIDAEIGRAFAETVRLTHTPEASAGERMEADHMLMELLAERTALRLQSDKKRERGH